MEEQKRKDIKDRLEIWQCLKTLYSYTFPDKEPIHVLANKCVCMKAQ